MPSWSHSKKEVRDALSSAAAAGFLVKESDGRGHSWGFVQCQRTDCMQRMSVWSTPKNQHDHAEQIVRFVRRHTQRHAEQDTVQESE
jgi:hypothetical protein